MLVPSGSCIGSNYVPNIFNAFLLVQDPNRGRKCILFQMDAFTLHEIAAQGI